jgi:hypothetical protein
MQPPGEDPDFDPSSIVASSGGQSIIIGGFDSIRILNFNPTKKKWEDLPLKKFDSFYTATCFGWKPDGAKLVIVHPHIVKYREIPSDVLKCLTVVSRKQDTRESLNLFTRQPVKSSSREYRPVLVSYSSQTLVIPLENLTFLEINSLSRILLKRSLSETCLLAN